MALIVLFLTVLRALVFDIYSIHSLPKVCQKNILTRHQNIYSPDEGITTAVQYLCLVNKKLFGLILPYQVIIETKLYD